MVFRRKKYYYGEVSDHFDGESFFFPDKPYHFDIKAVLKWRLFTRRTIWPKHVAVKPALDPVSRVHGKIRVTYIGHATLLIQTSGLNILTDPHFSHRAGPLRWIGPKRIQEPGLHLERLPPIDVVFVSHNHYDHLDIPSLRRIWRRDRPLIVTPLGNDTIIRRRIDSKMDIKTLDWGEEMQLGVGATLKLLPCQHWSGRTIRDYNRALWGAAYMCFEEHSVLFVGDTGFSASLFKQMRAMMKRTPDVIALPIGCYEPHSITGYSHMSPEQAWEAFNLLEGEKLLPTHYDVFPLANEPYGEALERLKRAAGLHLRCVLPLRVGEHAEL